MQKNFELKNTLATAAEDGDGLEDLSGDRQKELREKLVGQMKIPVYQKPHFWSPDFVKCDGKIIKYDLRALGIWRVSVYFFCEEHGMTTKSNELRNDLFRLS